MKLWSEVRRCVLTGELTKRAASHADGQATIQYHCRDGGGGALSNGWDTTNVFIQQVSHLDVAVMWFDGKLDCDVRL